MGTNPVGVGVECWGFGGARDGGAVVGLGADGSAALRLGYVTGPVFPRSANKPFQALAMLRAGLTLDGELLALTAASHSGEDFHVQGARRILASAGLAEDAFRCPAQWPLEPPAAYAVAARGEGPSPVRMNC